MRAVLFEEEHARSVVRRLVQDGFAAAVRREPFAGEDDDEDHPWVVETDAPDALVEVLVEPYDGWLEPDATPPPAAPLDLPTAPRRLKREG